MAVSRSRLLAACISPAVFTVLLITGCQGVANSAAPQAATASAFVYVLSNPGGSNFEINAFSAGLNGQLTQIAGSPFAVKGLAFSGPIATAMVANRDYLFLTDGSNIHSFSIASNGALTQVSSISTLQFNPNGELSYLFLDRTGASLYALHDLFDGANEGYDSFSVDRSTGLLTYLGTTPAGCCGNEALSFTGNNEYGYTTNCYHAAPSVSAFRRNNDGTLMRLSGGLMDSPDPGRLCPGSVAAGPAGNLAISFGADAGPGAPSQDSGEVLAVYSVDGSGVLTTSSTVANMPQISLGGMLVISTSGKFLATGGLGLEVLHFNGAAPITPFTGLLTNDQIDQITWDSEDNLYALSQSTNKLSVFTVTATSATQAPGSSYAITNPRGLAIAPRE